jgi:hypothetical protein
LIEGGYSLAEEGEETRHTIGELGIRFGLAKGWEARVSMNPLLVVQQPEGDDVSGPEELELGAKASIIASGGGLVPALSVFGYGLVPLDGGERPAVLPGLRAIAGWGLTDRLSLGSNLGWLYDGVADDRFSCFSGSLVLSVSIDSRWSGFAEYYGFWPTGDRNSSNFANAGVTFLTSNNVQLDLRVGTGLEGPWPDYFAGLGAAFRI